jgi:hypothetical protein
MIAPSVVSLVQDVDLGRPCASELNPSAAVRAHLTKPYR